MCGIAGHVAFPRADAALVQNMIEVLSHRGPDGMGTFHEGPVALGHTRLAIIDLQTGEQPKFNEDRTVAVVFNGEIYNYRELRRELGERHQFTSESDTEVLVHLYEELGERMVHRLDGMFSFAIWDAQRERLIAARDRFGEKPFLYLSDARGFFFASEASSFVAAGLCRGEIDRSALSDYLTLLYVPAPKTIWKQIRKLPPGSILTVERQGMKVTPYWRPPAPGLDRAVTPSVDRIQSELRRSVRARLRSDVPMGALLSGGIDSSTVVALMAEELGPGVKTFSVGFGREDDELEFARLVADRYRTDHHEIHVTRDLVEQTTDAFRLFSEPLGDSSVVPTTAVFREVAKHVKVVLTGDGGDELFAGYDRYRLIDRLPTLPNIRFRWPLRVTSRYPIARRARRLMRAVTTSGVARSIAMLEVFSSEERSALLRSTETESKDYGIAEIGGHADSGMAFDLALYLPDDLLLKVDISSMGASVESRAPLLDHMLAECVVPLSASMKMNKHEGKLLLKKAVASLVPPAILGRPKRGFGSPVQQWLSGPLRELFLDTVGAKTALVGDWLDSAVVAQIVQGVLSGRTNPHQGWALLALESWGQQFVRVRPEFFKPRAMPARQEINGTV